MAYAVGPEPTVRAVNPAFEAAQGAETVEPGVALDTALSAIGIESGVATEIGRAATAGESVERTAEVDTGADEHASVLVVPDRTDAVDAPEEGGYVVDEEVEPGDSPILEVEVENGGDGTKNVTVHRDGEFVDSQRVHVGAGESHTLTFSPTFEEEGEYELTVGDEASVTVTVAAQEGHTPTDTPTATPTDEPTPTDTPEPGGAPTPEDDDGGIGVPLLVVGLVLIVVIGGTGVWYYQQ